MLRRSSAPGEGLVSTAVQKLERQAGDLERISAVLASHNKQAFHRKDQDFRMWMAGLGRVIRRHVPDLAVAALPAVFSR